MNEQVNAAGNTANAAGDMIGNFLTSVGLPAGLSNVITVLLILIVGMFIAKFIGGMVRRVINKTGIASRLTDSGSKTDLGKSIGKLVYYVILLFVLLIVLERLGVTSVLDPLKNLVNKFTNALPNVIGAGIVFYAGWIISNLASSAVGLGASKLDTQLVERGFNPEFKISKFLSAFVLGAILLPIVVAGFQVLNIPAISDPAVAMVQEFMGAVPNIVAAGIILLVAYMMSKFIVMMLGGLLDGMNVNAIPAKMGMGSMFNEERTAVGVIGQIVTFFIMLTAGTAAVEKLNIDIVSRLFGGILEFGGGIVVGGIILLLGAFLANLAHEKLTAAGQGSIANIARIAILGLVLAMGLRAMGLADNIVNMAFGFTFGAIAIATALAFGMGGKDAAGKIANKWADKF